MKKTLVYYVATLCVSFLILLCIGLFYSPALGYEKIEASKNIMENCYLTGNIVLPESGLNTKEKDTLQILKQVHSILSSKTNVNDILAEARPIFKKLWGKHGNSGMRFIVNCDANNMIDKIKFAPIIEDIYCLIEIDPDSKIVITLAITLLNNDEFSCCVGFSFHQNGRVARVDHINNKNEFIGHHITWDQNGRIISERNIEVPEKLKPFFEVKGKSLR
jgi:hypothetical protein